MRSKLARRICRRFRIDPEELFALRNYRREQLRCLLQLAEGLRSILPNLEFVVCGIDCQGKMPAWITDMRVDEINEATNRAWAEQGARSHVLFGVLGSHMVLPGSLAGAYIELVPKRLTTNVLTTAPVRATEVREAIFSYRLIPADVTVDSLKAIIIEILLDYPYMRLTLCEEYYKSIDQHELKHVREFLSKRNCFINSMPKTPGIRLFN